MTGYRARWSFTRSFSSRQKNLSNVKTSNKAALEHLEAALLLIKTLDQGSLLSIGKEIAMMSEVVSKKRLFNEQYRRSVESLRETLRGWCKSRPEGCAGSDLDASSRGTGSFRADGLRPVPAQQQRAPLQPGSWRHDR